MGGNPFIAMSASHGSGFDLGLVADQLEVHLKWATEHRLSAGTHAEAAPITALAVWLVKTGTLRVRFVEDDPDADQDVISLRQGDAVVMVTDRRRVISACQDASWLSAGFTVRILARDYSTHLFPEVFIWHPSVDEKEELHSLLELARSHCSNMQKFRPTPFPLSAPPDSIRQWVADGVVRAVIHHVWQQCADVRHFHPASTSKDSSHRLMPVLLHIATRPDSASVESMSGIAGVSPSQLNRLFRRYVGTSPQKHLTATRLQRAFHLLLTTESTIAFIARSVGFESLSHFTRLFHAHFGETPARYRDSHRSAQL